MKPVVVAIVLVAAVASIVVGAIRIRSLSVPPVESREPMRAPGESPAAAPASKPPSRMASEGTTSSTQVMPPAPKFVESHPFVPPEVPAGWITGRIVDEHRQPIEGTAVQVVGGEGLGSDYGCFGREYSETDATTDAAGRWRMAMLESRTIRLRVTKAGFAPLVVPEFSYSSGETRDIGDVALGGGATVSGRVVDRVGHPVEGVRIEVSGEKDRCETSTDCDGAFALDGLPSGATVSVRVADDRFVVSKNSDARDVVAPAGDVRFIVERRIRLRVIIVDDSSGEPLESAWARLMRINGSGALAFSKRENSERGSVVEFGDDVPPDTYSLVAGSRGYEPSDPTSIAIEPDAPGEVTVRLAHRCAEANGSLLVTAVDDAGRIVRPVRLAVQPKFDWDDPTVRQTIDWTAMLERTTEADDEFVDLPPGTYWVDVTARDDFHQSAHTSATIRSGALTSIAVDVPATGRLVVDVLDPDGWHGISRAIVLRDAVGLFVAAPFGGARISGSSDADGEWIGPRVAAHVRPDVYALTVRGRGNATRTVTAIVCAGEISVVEVVFDGGEASFIDGPLEVKPR